MIAILLLIMSSDALAAEEDRPPWTEISVQEKGDEVNVVGIATGPKEDLSILRLKTVENARLELQAQFPQYQLIDLPLHTLRTFEEAEEDKTTIRVYRLFSVSMAEIKTYIAANKLESDKKLAEDQDRNLASLSESQTRSLLPWSSGLLLGYQDIPAGTQLPASFGYVGLHLERRFFTLFGPRVDVSWAFTPNSQTSDLTNGVMLNGGLAIYPIYNHSWALGLVPSVAEIYLGSSSNTRKSVAIEFQDFFSGDNAGGWSLSASYSDFGPINTFTGPRSFSATIGLFGRF